MATLTTVAVFVPVSLVEGGGRFFLQRLSIPISVSLLASLGVALVIIPLATYVTLPNGRGGGSRTAVGPAWHAVLRRAYDATFGRLNRPYGRLLGVCLHRRLDVIMVLIALLGTVVVLFRTGAVRMVPMQEDEAPAFELDLDLPRNTPFEETQAYFLEAERVMEDLREELGLDGYLTVFDYPDTEDPSRPIRKGDYLDCWEVLEVDRPRRLKMRADVDLPGDPTMEFRLERGEEGTEFTQIARFRPRGVPPLTATARRTA
jgi:multidrug efflux pump subunit AcrB